MSGADNDDAQGTLDAFLDDVAPIRKPRVDPGHAALIALQPPENRDLVAQVLTAQKVVKTLPANERGRAAHQSGVDGEAWVTAHHDRALERGLAKRIDHVGPPTAPHIVNGRAQYDRRGRLIVVVTGLAPPDYLGTLCDSRSLAVEAKRRTGRLHAPLTDEELAQRIEDVAAIERHQADYLADVDAAGGLALVLVTFVRSHQRRPYEIRCAVPWHVVTARWSSPRGGRPGVGPEELEGYHLAASVDCYLQRFVP